MEYIYKYILVFVLLVVSLLVYISESDFEWRYKFFVVSSDSMQESLSKGDLLAVKVDSKLGVGDIITFNSPIGSNEFITHRIVKENFEGEFFFTTKGDNNHIEDPWQITPDMVVGSVEYSIPFIGYAVLFLSGSKTYLFILMGLILLISVVEINTLSGEAVSIWKTRNRFRIYRRIKRVVVSADKLLSKYRNTQTENAG